MTSINYWGIYIGFSVTIGWQNIVLKGVLNYWVNAWVSVLKIVATYNFRQRRQEIQVGSKPVFQYSSTTSKIQQHRQVS